MLNLTLDLFFVNFLHGFAHFVVERAFINREGH